MKLVFKKSARMLTLIVLIGLATSMFPPSTKSILEVMDVIVYQNGATIVESPNSSLVITVPREPEDLAECWNPLKDLRNWIRSFDDKEITDTTSLDTVLADPLHADRAAETLKNLSNIFEQLLNDYYIYPYHEKVFYNKNSRKLVVLHKNEFSIARTTPLRLYNSCLVGELGSLCYLSAFFPEKKSFNTMTMALSILKSLFPDFINDALSSFRESLKKTITLLVNQKDRLLELTSILRNYKVIKRSEEVRKSFKDISTNFIKFREEIRSLITAKQQISDKKTLCNMELIRKVVDMYLDIIITKLEELILKTETVLIFDQSVTKEKISNQLLEKVRTALKVIHETQINNPLYNLF